ncbi:YitT family protein [Clostridium ihumii]|uniref:YitT family protein n=1 Tax=Clostridium ihumii TaxID=1470356 RepID=UPI000590ACF3|nr:YitT family protein [Clostridium ihumii]
MSKKLFKELFFITIGLIFLAAGLSIFLVPNNLAAGGISGIAIVVNNYIPALSVPVIMLGLDVILYIIGFIFIGASFGVKSIYCSLMLPTLMAVIPKVLGLNGPIVDDLLINLVFGIIIGAVGMGIIFNQDASTGGTDIIAKILNKYLRLDIGKGLLITDFSVTLMAVAAFGPMIGMYSLLGVIINGFTVDYIIDGFNVIRKVEIVSSENEKIKKFIMEELGRGATVYEAKGAYTEERKQVLTAVMDKKEFIKLRGYIRENDKNAFVIIYNVHETLGEGFGSIV